ncbi:MAG: hypothetical protein A2W22_01430 [Candidatus Levybacteria bacterium RBG_16_35_11]|nr:MAG: hypothetical protein A2W22_01430 [Candidatus Levybacteria bacterium RBG_16_35_11]
MKISIIVAVDEKNGIGRGGELLFKIPEDHKRFKKLTTGHPVIMGRRTFEKDIGRCLPNRSNIIITRNSSFSVKGGMVANSLKDALNFALQAPGNDECFIIGGGQVYQEAIDIADKLYLTKVKGVFKADTVFPNYSKFKKKVFEKEGESNGFKFTFLELER